MGTIYILMLFFQDGLWLGGLKLGLTLLQVFACVIFYCVGSGQCSGCVASAGPPVVEECFYVFAQRIVSIQAHINSFHAFQDMGNFEVHPNNPPCCPRLHAMNTQWSTGDMRQSARRRMALMAGTACRLTILLAVIIAVV